MTNPIDRLHGKLIDHIAAIVREHSSTTSGGGCSCGAQSLPDHSRHVAERIVDHFDLAPETVDEVKNRIRYATAVMDWELTKLEGAQE